MDFDQLKWTDVRDFGVLGKGWTDTEGFYDRFPARAHGLVRDEVWQLSRNPSGMRVHFLTDSNVLAADWTLPVNDAIGSDHMPATGKSGLDLYIRHRGSWRWLGAGRLDGPGRNRKFLFPDKLLLSGRHEYMLYLPLYNRLESLLIGLAPSASLDHAKPLKAKPICYYGTSITQGGCASRPGMTYAAILGRRLEQPFLNFGFSGNARLEPEIARLLSELEPSIYVLDPLANVPMNDTAKLAEPFIRTLRSARPKTPIVLVENVIFENACFIKSRMDEIRIRNKTIRKLYLKLRKEGMKHLRYVPADGLLGSDGEATVDGVHFTDLGFMRFSDVLEPVLRKLL